MIKLIFIKIIRFFYRLFSKIIYFLIPFISKILIMLRIHSRIINQLNKLRSEAHNIDNHSAIISKLLNNNKLVALDVGAQGGFFNAKIFSHRYNRVLAASMTFVSRIFSLIQSTIFLTLVPGVNWGNRAFSKRVDSALSINL